MPATYKIISGPQSYVEREVTQLMLDDWWPVGGLTVTGDAPPYGGMGVASPGLTFAQAVVKDDGR